MNLVARAVRKAVDDGNDGVTTDAERRAETLGSVLKNAARVLVAVFFVLVTLQEFGVNIQPLLAGSAVARRGPGLPGAQTLVKDIIAGFFLLLENQFGVGDIISVDQPAQRHGGAHDPARHPDPGPGGQGPLPCPTAPSARWWS